MINMKELILKIESNEIFSEEEKQFIIYCLKEKLKEQQGGNFERKFQDLRESMQLSSGYCKCCGK